MSTAVSSLCSHLIHKVITIRCYNGKDTDQMLAQLKNLGKISEEKFCLFPKNVNFVWRCQECVQNGGEHFQHLLQI
jgi:hypothetical protein